MRDPIIWFLSHVISLLTVPAVWLLIALIALIVVVSRKPSRLATLLRKPFRIGASSETHEPTTAEKQVRDSAYRVEPARVLKRLGLSLAVLVFAVFVWPTPYRIVNDVKVSRLQWALGWDLKLLAEPDNITFFVIGSLCSAPLGYIVGFFHGNRLRRRKS